MSAENAGARRAARRKHVRLAVALGIVFVVVVGGLVGYALRSDNSTASAKGKLSVVTTTNFLDDTVRQVGGDHVDTVRLMSPGVDPHLYQAKSGDLDAMRDADAVFAVGLFLEGSMEQTLHEMGRTKPVVFAGERIPKDRLLSPPAGAAPQEEHDPHVWFDPQLWAYVVDAVRDELIRLDPAHAADYRTRAAEYRAEVLALTDEIRATLRQIPAAQRSLVTSHDAFRYFGRAFDIDVTAIQGISTQQEATTADIGRVARIIAGSDVRAVFVESSVSRQTLESVLAAVRQQGKNIEIGGELFSDSAGDDGTAEGSYVGMIRANAERLVKGLR